MNFDAIRTEDKVDITDINDTSLGGVSRVFDILDIEQKMLLIHAPMSGKNVFNLDAGSSYTISVYNSTTKLKHIFNCIFVQYMKKEDTTYAAVRILDEGERVQRRSFFRFSCALGMKFSVLDYGDNQAAKMLHDAGYTERYDAVIRDIGGGGIRFITNHDINEKYDIQCHILLANSSIMIKGKILNKQFMPKSSFKFQYRLEFLNVSQKLQDRIVDYIFMEQRKQKRTALTKKV